MAVRERVAGMSVLGKTLGSLAVALVVIVAAVGIYFGVNRATTHTVTAYFPSTTGLYEGDPVRVIGVNIGKVTEVQPREHDVKVVMRIDDDIPVPADAKAVIVAQSLVSGRFIQFSPSYTGGPKLAADADIPMERTVIPMEWDDVKKQLDELSTALGPNSDGKEAGTAADTIDTLAANLDGNGAAMATSIKEMSQVAGTLSNRREDLFATVKSLQKLTDLLADNHDQLVQFNGRIADVSDVLADADDDLGDAMENLDEATGALKTFLDRNSGELGDTVTKLAQFTGTLKNKDEELRGLLHSAPNQLANFMNIYNPMNGALDGVFGLGMGNNLITLLCGSMDSTARPMDTEENVEKCVDLIAPIMKDVVVNYPPFIANPLIGRAAYPDQIYYQNQSVKERAQQGEQERDVASTKPDTYVDPVTKLLLPFGGGR
ncbi:MCE family protein [Gordonia sp. VNK21]|uniref:MCE family protein n=1 Tax=Gordonia sp. VNK21 TaxID=3382483 RepID=UPI0038D48987